MPRRRRARRVSSCRRTLEEVIACVLASSPVSLSAPR
jgi:hypothetical protein